MNRPMSHSESQTASPGQDSATRKQIRGSTLLLTGRGVSLLINLAVQVIVVRYLAKETFGAFAFAITMVALGANLSCLGLAKSLSRFVPIYHERGDNARLAGSIVLMLGTVTGLGIATMALVFGMQSFIASHVTSDPLSLSLLLVLIVLVPVDSLDRLLESLYAAFGRVRSIFIRRHLIGPGLKLLAVLTVVQMGGSAYMLACFYVAAGVGGILIYALLLRQMLRREKLLQFFRPGAWKMPVREIFSFSLPLFSSQIGFVVRTSLAVLLLEMMRGSAEVAELRAVFPFARLNEVVITSFAFLFTPLASRFFARNETEHIDELYWRTSVWITIFSLPAFLVTAVLAQPFTAFVLGERYASAWPVLLILATAFFIDAVMGFNVHTLRVFAKVRYIVTIDVIGIVTGVGLCLALIPAWGAMGAAVAICAATILQNVLFQIAMRVFTGVGVLNWQYAKFYGVSAAGVAVLALVQWTWNPPLLVGLALAIAIYASVLLSSRSLMNVQETFPELLRLPILGRLLTVSSKAKLAAAGEGGS